MVKIARVLKSIIDNLKNVLSLFLAMFEPVQSFFAWIMSDFHRRRLFVLACSLVFTLFIYTFLWPLKIGLFLQLGLVLFSYWFCACLIFIIITRTHYVTLYKFKLVWWFLSLALMNSVINYPVLSNFILILCILIWFFFVEMCGISTGLQ
jgi:hypothetical protein